MQQVNISEALTNMVFSVSLLGVLDKSLMPWEWEFQRQLKLLQCPPPLAKCTAVLLSTETFSALSMMMEESSETTLSFGFLS